MKQRGTFIAFWLLASLLQASAADDFLQRVRDKILHSQPFKTDFIQQVFIDEEKILEESGIIIFADRSRVKWQYLNPEAKIFILKDGNYNFYDRENNQLMRGRIGARSEQLIWELLFSDRPGNASSWDAQQRTIRLRLDGEGGVQELKIKVGTDYLPERVEQTAVNEVTTVYLFSNYRNRITLNPGEFDLALPVDVEIIEE
ncbi:MAG: outer-membrane lipoprotein carrier protein LolA [Acidobacteria bacterium]|nr:outer-membrane lipoprotein carrier protein LolA [Acidobacteriota bacterium]MBU4307888.1 outer-membrane lipoprotein carrier protein LolA [Acidobacteriota bacterium]MBU4405178.1 outer-membrane lipoprotein carrier protein LolA [Acidobacteriota bacterium]MCG2811026.1 outer-membrane lipoprotein carrier protein LolA [Candidatus Aminicenantes bacterium]